MTTRTWIQLHLLLLPLVAALATGGCKKDSGSPTEPVTTPTIEPTFSFTFDGKDYSGDAYAGENKLTQRLFVGVQASRTGGDTLRLEIYFSTTKLKADTTMTLTKGDPNPYAHFVIGDPTNESNIFCSRTGSDRNGSVTVTKWTGTEIAGTFSFVGGCHNTGLGTTRTVTNAKFKATSFQQVK